MQYTEKQALLFQFTNFAFVSVCPQALFGLQSLHILGLSDNELTVLPSAVSNLANLREVDISKNGELKRIICLSSPLHCGLHRCILGNQIINYVFYALNWLLIYFFQV